MTSEIMTVEKAIELAPARPLDQNPAAVYLAGLTPTGRRSQLHALRVVAEILTNQAGADPLALPWEQLRYQHIAGIRARLVERYKPATVNRTLSAIRGVMKAAWRLGQTSSEDYYRAVDIKQVEGETIPAGRELSAGELSALMSDCEHDTTDTAGARDAAIIAILYAAGLRRDEVVRLDLENYDTESGRLLVTGKRSKERTAYLTNGALDAMADWLAIRGDDPGPLFLAINKGGAIQPGRMTNQAIYDILAKRGKRAGVKKFTPHDMRRTFVSDLLDAGADIATVAKMAGHASVNTTARYDRRTEEAKQKAAAKLHIPYRRRT